VRRKWQAQIGTRIGELSPISIALMAGKSAFFYSRPQPAAEREEQQ
jgi:hypothetical protein